MWNVVGCTVIFAVCFMALLIANTAVFPAAILAHELHPALKSAVLVKSAPAGRGGGQQKAKTDETQNPSRRVDAHTLPHRRLDKCACPTPL